MIEQMPDQVLDPRRTTLIFVEIHKHKFTVVHAFIVLATLKQKNDL